MGFRHLSSCASMEHHAEMSELHGLSGSATEEALRQLVQQGFDYSQLVRIVLELTRVSGHRPSIREVLSSLLRSHPVGDLARTWSSAGVLVPRPPPTLGTRSAVATPPILQRSSTVPPSGTAATCPPPLFRTASSPASASAGHSLRLHSQYAGASLEAVARLLLRAVHAEGSGHLSTEQCHQLKEQLRLGELDAVHEQLQRLQVAPGDVLKSDGEHISMDLAVPRASFECPICFDQVSDDQLVPVPCDEQHMFCRECLMHHVEAVAFPQCPHAQCRYELTEDDVKLVCGDGPRLREFKEMNLQRALTRLHGRVECPNPQCSNVVVCDPEKRTRVVCACGWPAFCSMCRQPYHYHSTCGMVQPLRARWLNWISEGRTEYHGLVSGLDEATAKHQSVVKGAIDRHRELEGDEEWKAQMCRLCPKCFRTIEKTEGCSSMVCGRNYHGGNEQQGCGHSFVWDSAPRYQPRVERKFELPKLEFCSESKVQCAYVRHLFTTCNLCQRSLRGPRFQCIHCEAFDCCVECEPKLAASHSQEHVFDILFEPSDPINRDLLVGTQVEVYGLEGTASTLNGISAKILRYLPDMLSYELDLPFGSGQGIVPAKNIQPAEVADQCEAQEVLERSLAQQDARIFSLNLQSGQLVQLLSPSLRPELHHQLGTVVQYRRATNPMYEVELKSPPDWTCIKCTLNNIAQAMRCAACGEERGKDQGRNVWISASETTPLIADASEVKELAILHFAEQGRLISAAVANQYANESLGHEPLNLPALQQVLCLQEADDVFVRSGRALLEVDDVFGHVVLYEPWSCSYKIVLQAPACGEVSLHASLVRAVFWKAAEPMSDAETCTLRHQDEQQRLKAVEDAHQKLLGTYLNLPKSQEVIVKFSSLLQVEDSDVCPELVAGLCSGRTLTASGDHAVTPAIILEYCPAQGKYMLAPVPDMNIPLQIKEVAVENVRPVLWKSRQPEADAKALCAAHQEESKRLRQVIEANTFAQDARRGLSPGTFVEVCDPVCELWVVKSFVRLDCSYILSTPTPMNRKKEKQFSASRVRPVFWHASDPLTEAQAACEADKAEELRLGHCTEAETIAQGSYLALPVHSLVRCHNSNLCRINSYNPQTQEYKISSMTFSGGQKSFCSACAGNIDWGSKVVNANRPAYCACCGNLQPERLVPCRDVAPAFLAEEDPLTKAEEVCKKHATELKRLEDVVVANEKTQCGGYLAMEAGQLVCLLGEGMWRRPSEEHNGQAKVVSYDSESMSYIIDLGLWTNLKAFGSNTTGTGGSTSRITVGARYLKPLFWETKDPANAVEEIVAKHDSERQRRRDVKESMSRCSDACLGFPGLTDVLLKSSSIYMKEYEKNGVPLRVHEWCPFSQTYKMKSTVAGLASCGPCSLNGMTVSASDVQPNLWGVKDPISAADKFIQLHKDEEVRLQHVIACEQQFGAGTLGLPIGMPVRIVQSISNSKGACQSNSSRTWRSWLRRSVPFLPAKGCAVDDLAVVLSYDLNASYCLAVQNDCLQWALECVKREGVADGTVSLPSGSWTGWLRIDGVSADAVRPCFTAASDPRALARRLRDQHAEAEARLDRMRQITASIDTSLLDLPSGTAVVVDGIGQCTISSYEPRSAGYVVRRQSSVDTLSSVFYVAAEKVKPTCADIGDRDPAETLARFKCRHQAERKRLDLVHEANALVADLYGNLPVGLEVRVLPTAHDHGAATASACDVGLILRHIDGDDPRYLLQLYTPTASSISSDAYREVSTHQVRAVFWTSRQPVEDANSLIRTCRGSTDLGF